VPPLCEALQFAHERGIVHRDIKPENLLLDKAGRVKIADFGVARMLGAETQLAEESAAGTPGYMAPEQTTSPERVDSRADIYSLGVVFYEMLTGELPTGAIQPPSRKVQVDVRIDEIVLRALEKEPALRFQTADDVRAAVGSFTRAQVEESAGAAPARSPGPDRQWMRLWGYILLVPGLPVAIFGLFMLWLVRQDPDWNPAPREALISIGSWVGALLLLGGSAVLLLLSRAPSPPPARNTTTTADPWPRWVLWMLGLFLGLPALLMLVGLVVPFILFGHDRPAVNSLIGWLVALSGLLFVVILGVGLFGSRQHARRAAAGATQPPSSWQPVVWTVVALLVLPSLLVIVGIAIPGAQRARMAATEQRNRSAAALEAINAQFAHKPAHISTAGGSAYAVQTTDELHFVLLHRGSFTSSNSGGSNLRSMQWVDEGAIRLVNGRSFAFQRGSVSPEMLKVNGEEFDLRKGTVILLLEDGTARQFPLFPQRLSSETCRRSLHCWKV
jgi:hypothetical protein